MHSARFSIPFRSGFWNSRRHTQTQIRVVFLCLFPYAGKNDSIKMKANKAFNKRLWLAPSCALLFSVAQQVNAGGTTGYNNGYFYETYYTGSGSTSITFPGGGGNFAATWTAGVTDSCAAKGWEPGSIRNINYNCGALSSSVVHAGGYGWAPYPNVEWYISDFGSNSGTFIGTVNSDGGTYNVFKGTQGGGPQYKDSRTVSQSKGVNHIITMANHVNYWKAHIGSFGTIRETVFMVEAFSGPGSCNATVW